MTSALDQLTTIRNSGELRDQFLRDIRLAAMDTGVEDPPVQPGSDWFLLGTAVANICLIGLTNTQIGIDAHSVLTAEDEDLEAIRIAEGLPEIFATGSSGKIVIRVDGPVSVTNGLNFVMPNGLRGEVVSTYLNPADRSEVNVRAIDTGSATNLEPGALVRFVTPPLNLQTEARVSDGEPLTGGTDTEEDDRKRDRILNVRRNKPAGGNWAQIVQLALDTLGSIQKCFVYCAPGGPGNAKVVPIKDYDVTNRDFSRALSVAALSTVRGAIQSTMPIPQDIVIQSAIDQECDFTLLLTIPASAQSGGNGQGWVDPAPWPPLLVGDASVVRITAVGATNDVITVSALTSISPISGVTHVVWWSQVDKSFHQATVISVSGTSGAWVLSLDHALAAADGTGPVIGDYVCPAAQNTERYGIEWVNLFRTFGPGENSGDGNRLPRARRHPYVADESPSDVTASTIASWKQKFPEISNYGIGASTGAAAVVPATLTEPPAIIRPRRFAVYAQ